jgi:hypothetical protein
LGSLSWSIFRFSIFIIYSKQFIIMIPNSRITWIFRKKNSHSLFYYLYQNIFNFCSFSYSWWNYVFSEIYLQLK